VPQDQPGKAAPAPTAPQGHAGETAPAPTAPQGEPASGAQSQSVGARTIPQAGAEGLATAAPTGAPAPAPPTPAPPTPRLPVHPDHARALLHIANHRGQAQARLTLHPAELGGVEVRLRVTTHGLVASITAERPESAQVLQQAGADLKRALEAQGVEVAALDFSVAGDEARQRADRRDADPTARRAANRADDDEELSPIDPDHPTTTAPTIALGALVDVLA
jgi:flagellar hook-length control protein FliK